MTPHHTPALRPRHAVVLALGFAPLLAFAHLGGTPGHLHTPGEALAAGFVHPFTGLDHLAAMVVLGLWSALTMRRVWIAPLAFAGTLLAGALLGMAGVKLPAVEPMIAASLLVLGLLLATKVRMPAAMGATVASAFALFHGVAHGTELAGANAAYALGGMVVATMLLHGAGIAIGWALRARHAWLPRMAGGAVALFGAALLLG